MKVFVGGLCILFVALSVGMAGQHAPIAESVCPTCPQPIAAPSCHGSAIIAPQVHEYACHGSITHSHAIVSAPAIGCAGSARYRLVDRIADRRAARWDRIMSRRESLRSCH